MSLAAGAAWLSQHSEDHTGDAADLNQYWYSAPTIGVLCDVVRECCAAGAGSAAAARLDCAFISTPSLFFAMEASERTRSRVLDYDRSLGTDEPGFIFYDFNAPSSVPAELHGAFACVVIDPPFITHEVWRQYAETARLLLAPGGAVIGTTILENSGLLHELLGVVPNTFLPSIPNLPYQYAVYSSSRSSLLDAPNPELPDVDPAEVLAAAAERGRADGSASTAEGAAAEAEAERPIRGRPTYDFEAMLEASLTQT